MLERSRERPSRGTACVGEEKIHSFEDRDMDKAGFLHLLFLAQLSLNPKDPGNESP